MFLIIIPAKAVIITNTIGDKLVKTDPKNTPKNIIIVALSTTELFHNFITALNISTHTHTLTPAKAFFTTGKSEKLLINAAIIVIITIEGNTTPSVATIPPMVPLFFCPINVSCIQDITPGVH